MFIGALHNLRTEVKYGYWREKKTVYCLILDVYVSDF